MINEHVTDAEIQLFILEERTCSVRVVEHIKHCSQCAVKTKEYIILFEGIELQEKPAFDFSLADIVVAQLPPAQHQDGFDKLFSYSIAFVVIVLVLTVFYFFKNAGLAFMLKVSSLPIGLIITTVASMMVFLIADMYRKYRKQMKAFKLS